jgi:hypothetical protein
MPREPDWIQEIREAKRRDPASVAWSLEGGSRLVKVVRLATVMNIERANRAVGYVTQEKFLLGKTPQQIEIALGLPPLSLNRGCRIFRLQRIPQRGEYSDELTADKPGGLAFNPAEWEEKRIRYDQDKSLNELSYYPPGDKRIPQWDVSVSIPLIHLTDLPPNVSYPKISI